MADRQTIFRTPDPFVRVPRAIIDDPLIGVEGLGILLWRSAQPADLTVSVDMIAEHFRWTRNDETLLRGLAQLRDAGYLDASDGTNDKGRYTVLYSVAGE